MPITLICPTCGAKSPLPRGEGPSPFCRHCGTRIDAPASAPVPVTVVLNPDPYQHGFAVGPSAPGLLVAAEPRPTRRRRRRHASTRRPGLLKLRLMIGAGLLAVAATVAYAGHLLLAPPTAPVRPSTNSPEYMVARHHVGGTLPSDRSVFRFRFLLQRVAESYGVPAREVAVRSIEAASRLAHRGRDADMAQILNGAVEAAQARVDPGVFAPSLGRYLSAYVDFRVQGRDHREAIAAINHQNLLAHQEEPL